MSSKSPDTLYCTKCSMGFNTRDELIEHRKYPCGTGVNAEDLIHHKPKPVVAVETPETLSNKESTTEKKKKTKGKRHYVCPWCRIDTGGLGKLYEHKRGCNKNPVKVAEELEMGGTKPPTEQVNQPLTVVTAEVRTENPMLYIRFCPKCLVLFDFDRDQKYCGDCGTELKVPPKRRSIRSTDH